MSEHWRSVCTAGADAMGDAVILQQRVTENGRPLGEHRLRSVSELVPDLYEEEEVETDE